MFEKLTAYKPLPSLNGLRAFEAMGRLGSATRAAAELHVTHSAVSRQVKALEAVLGVALFEGPKSKLSLTEAGSTLLAGLTQGFDTLGDAVRSVQVSNAVRIAIHNSLAVKWLIPRLPDFERLHPSITIELADLPVDAVRARTADLVVRFLDGDQISAPGVERLAPNYVGVVLSPAVEDGKSTLPMLAAASHPHGWLAWSEAGGPIEFGTHHSIESVWVNDVKVRQAAPDRLRFEVAGSIDVGLQWGSNSDVRRGDGAELDENFKFTLAFTASTLTPTEFEDTTYTLDLGKWERDVIEREDEAWP